MYTDNNQKAQNQQPLYQQQYHGYQQVPPGQQQQWGQNGQDPQIKYQPMEGDDRLGFIRKVYGILSCQLLFTALYSGLCMAVRGDGSGAFFAFQTSQSVMYFIIFTYIASICAIACCGFDRKVPVNYILLGIFTFCVSYLVGTACMRTPNPMTVVMAAALTFAMVVGLTFYAIRTKTDFTMCGGLLWVCGLVFMTASLFAVIIGGVNMHMGISVIGVILFSFYLVYDTQIIIGGKHRQFQFDEESYILAAVILYLDIINIFLYILSLLNGGDRE